METAAAATDAAGPAITGASITGGSLAGESLAGGSLAGISLAGPSIETLEAMLDVTYTWGYQETREKLRDLYQKAVRAQWISDDVPAVVDRRRPEQAARAGVPDAAARLGHLQPAHREGAPRSSTRTP